LIRSTLYLGLFLLLIVGCSKAPVTDEQLVTEITLLTEQCDAWIKEPDKKELAETAHKHAKEILDRFEDTEVGEAQKSRLETVRLLKTSLGFAKSAADPREVPRTARSSPLELVNSTCHLLKMGLRNSASPGPSASPK
jgi:hypothetical protein